MTIPQRPISTWDIKDELSKRGVLSMRDSDTLDLIDTTSNSPISILDLEGASVKSTLTLLTLDGSIIVPVELGLVLNTDIELTMSGAQLKITGLDLVEVIGWDRKPNYVPYINGYQFNGCTNLIKVPVNLPNWVNDTNLMFRDCTTFNQDLSGWDTGNVTGMYGVFYNCTMFNGDVTTWNLTGVANVGDMFYNCVNFNQDISIWDVSSITDMSYMLQNCSSFNQDLSGWCVSNIPTAPSGFDSNTTDWTLPRPMWGTCPVII